jgi:formylglycine-generating enzyme required for sulfatase activity
MVVVSAGSFTMGSPPEEGGDDAERPQHPVTIAKRFAVSKYELTFAQWDTCVDNGDCPRGVSDSGFGRGSYPVINVTWDDAKRYATWLSKATGKNYRLLTEAEYEYATRAGSETAYPWGQEAKLKGLAMAKCARCGTGWPHNWDDQRTSPVAGGPIPANRFGLYDMVGNVWEWTEDCVHTNEGLPTYNGAPIDGSAWIEGGNCESRIARGGSWVDQPEFVRSASRTSYDANTRNNNLGFRVARTLLAN